MTLSKIRNRKRKIVQSCIYVLHNTCNQEVSSRSRTRTAKKCVTKKRDSRAKLLFC